MAEPITIQQLIDASQDAETLEQVVNGGNTLNVTSREGRVYPTIAKALYEVIQTGGYEPFLTQSALLSSVPTIPKKAAVALDTGKTWYWNGSSWTDTGWGAPLSVKPNLSNENLDDVLVIGIYRQEDGTKATLANNYPTETNGAGILEVISRGTFWVQNYVTWAGQRFWRVKSGTNAWFGWFDIATDSKDIALKYKPGLTTQSLNDIVESGVYRQSANANATLARNYPTETNGAGQLTVIAYAGFIRQEYMTWYGEMYWRIKSGTNNWFPLTWNKVESDGANIALRYKPNLTTESLNNIFESGVYRQPTNSLATLANNYPTETNGAGQLVVITNAGFTRQIYTTWYGEMYWRIKSGTNNWYPMTWNKVATTADIPDDRPYKNKKIVWFGDSIVDGNNHPIQIGTALGATVNKFGFSSCTMSKVASDPNGYDKLTMYRFAKAINTEDFSEVIAGAEYVRDNYARDHTAKVTAMAALDWSTVDYVVIAFGTNDFTSATPLGNTYTADATGSTYIGATCYAIEQIQSKYPKIQIMLIGMPFRLKSPFTDPNINSDLSPDAEGKYLVDYENALVEIGKKYHIPVFEFNKKSGINVMTYPIYYSDGLHPNSTGVTHWVKKIKAFLLGN